MATLAELIVETQLELSLLNGLSVQTYAEPKIAAKIQRVFNDVFDKRFWKDHRKFATFTTDGVTGIPIGIAANEIQRYSDVQYVWHSDYEDPLTEASGRINPLRITRLSITPAAGTIAQFKVLPLSEANTFAVAYRTCPEKFVDDDEIPFDRDYIVLETMAEYLIDEGANLAFAQTIQQKAQDRLNTLLKNETAQDKTMGSETAAYLTEWR